jgi:hypothetical protein
LFTLTGALYLICSGAWGQSIGQSAYGLLAGQEAQESATSNVAGQVNATITNAARQSTVARMQDSIMASQPVDQNGSAVRVTGTASMTGTTGAAGGIEAGLLASNAAAYSIETSLDGYNTGAAGSTQSYLSALATTKFPTLAASNIIGDASGDQGAGAAYNPQATQIAIHTLTNPVPLVALPSAIASMPIGKRYTALRNVQQADVEAAQDTLTLVASYTAPLYPLGTWANNQMSTLAQNGATSVQQPINSFTSSATQTATQQQTEQSQQSAAESSSTLSSTVAADAFGANPAAPTSGGARIALNTVYWVMDMQRFGNPTWWQSISTSPSEAYLLQQIVEERAILSSIEDRTALLEQRIAAMQAINEAGTANRAASTAKNLGNNAISAAAVQ